MKYTIQTLLIMMSCIFVISCGNTDDSPSLGAKAKDQIDKICIKETTCKPSLIKQSCIDERTSFYLKLAGSERESEYMDLQNCALNLDCAAYTTKTGCETEKETYLECEDKTPPEILTPL